MSYWFKFIPGSAGELPPSCSHLLGDVFGAGQCEELLARSGVSASWQHPAQPDASPPAAIIPVDEVILSLGGLLPGAPMGSLSGLLPDSAKGSSHFWKVTLLLGHQRQDGSPLLDTPFWILGPLVTAPQVPPACLRAHEGQSIIPPQVGKSGKS